MGTRACCSELLLKSGSEASALTTYVPIAAPSEISTSYSGLGQIGELSKKWVKRLIVKPSIKNHTSSCFLTKLCFVFVSLLKIN